MARRFARKKHGPHEGTGRFEMGTFRVARVRHLAGRPPQVGRTLEQSALRGRMRRNESPQVDVVDAFFEILERADRLHPLAMESVETNGSLVLHEAHGA